MWKESGESYDEATKSVSDISVPCFQDVHLLHECEPKSGLDEFHRSQVLACLYELVIDRLFPFFLAQRCIAVEALRSVFK